ncbi:hypothetical protein CGZ93_00740 [Enemella dayhoffiae]|uniref:Uncharacterized protein n=1 Tax=Enemella dayhoffiae TaxID=2016507 RepID=A0A255HB16_9ACTN|nr:hypothetical protein CGZ93_00740 [Enemella dayhoffiae]
MQDVGIVRNIRRREDGGTVVLESGRRLEPDVVLVACGYATALEELIGDLDVLDAGGHPRSVGGTPARPGLYFTGFTNPISGMFRELRLDAEAIARSFG